MNAGQRSALSEFIRSSDDVFFYRHWHGPLYLYFLIPISRVGVNEHIVRTALLAIPGFTLGVIYFGCIWLIPGLQGIWLGLSSGLLFLSSRSVTGATELAPHHLFMLCAIGSLFLLAKFLITDEPRCWYGAVVAAALAFCTLEIAFVLILVLVICGFNKRKHVRVGRTFAAFAATVIIVWPAAVLKLSFVKAYIFMVYLALFRNSPWGDEGFLEIWRVRLLNSPLEWTVIVVGLLIYLRKHVSRNRIAYAMLMYAAIMLAATARILTSTARYSLLFMPALDIFAAFALVPFIAAFPKRMIYAGFGLFCGLVSINQYRLFSRTEYHDPRPAAVLSLVRENRLERMAMLVPQDDVPMLHYYFPSTQLRGYLGPQPDSSDLNKSAKNGIIYRGYPVRFAAVH